MMKKRKTLKQLEIPKGLPKRVLALTLCVAMLGPLLAYILPKQVVSAAVNPIGSLENLYIREADENTMDSYVQASLGGLIYYQRYDPWLFNGTYTQHRNCCR